MAYPHYVVEKARQLRINQKLTIDEISERLAIPRTTIFYWVGDLEISRKPNKTWPATAHIAAAKSNRERFRALREAAYQRGVGKYDEFASIPGFRDFVILYIAEGYKRSRNQVSICNSDPAVLRLAKPWMQ